MGLLHLDTKLNLISGGGIPALDGLLAINTDVDLLEINTDEDFLEFGGAPFEPKGSPIGWWKADAITGLNDDEDVDSWIDSSGNNYTMTEVTNPPIYKTNIQNSLPSVRFSNPSLLHANDVGVAYSNEYLTLHIVLGTLATTKYSIFSMHKDPADANVFQQFEFMIDGDRTPDYSPEVWFGNDSDTDFDWVSENFTGPALYTVIRDGTGLNVSIWKNGVNKVLANSNSFDLTMATLDCFRFGSRSTAGNSSPFDGDIFEVVVYNSALSSNQRTANETGLMAKWGL